MSHRHLHSPRAAHALSGRATDDIVDLTCDNRRQRQCTMIRIEQLNDPRILPYGNLRDRTLRGESIFVAEGCVVVERLLRSRYRAESVLVAEGHAAAFAAMATDCPLYVATPELLRQIAGFNFHLGALAVGRRAPAMGLDEVMAGPLDAPCCVVVCPAVTKPENLGLVFRNAAAFGTKGVVLGRGCCDPLSRRCLRVSMGAVLEVPFARSNDVLADLRALRHTWRCERVAAVLDPAAEELGKLRPAPRTAFVFGNEFDGLAPTLLAEGDRRITIPMSRAVDSLNLGVAAGIFIYHWSAAKTDF
jgi:tRNA G18 (ribose-2'-O)-methylase SpoU